MTDLTPLPAFTAFVGTERLATGDLASVACAAHAHGDVPLPVLVFDDLNARVVDLDLRGSAKDVADRYAPKDAEPSPRVRGRPKLGVVPREVTLLPRHWEWLQAQTGGASAALRRLVEEARKADDGKTDLKAAQERTYRFLTAMAGDLAGYEEAVRALFAGDGDGFAQRIEAWPTDIRDYALSLSRA